MSFDIELLIEHYLELGNLEEARFRRVNRIRKGVVQRRKLVSTQKGWTFRGGKFTRMRTTERLRRHRSQLKAARKRKATQYRAAIKRKRSERKRGNLGFNRKKR